MAVLKPEFWYAARKQALSDGLNLAGILFVVDSFIVDVISPQMAPLWCGAMNAGWSFFFSVLLRPINHLVQQIGFRFTLWFVRAATSSAAAMVTVIATGLSEHSAHFVLIVTLSGVLSSINSYYIMARSLPEITSSSMRWGASEQAAADADGTIVRELRESLVNLAVEERQVVNLKLSPDELKLLKADINEDIDSKAADIARSTADAHHHYSRARARYQKETSAPALTRGSVWFKWSALLLGCFASTAVVLWLKPGAKTTLMIIAAALAIVAVLAFAAPRMIAWKPHLRHRMEKMRFLPIQIRIGWIRFEQEKITKPRWSEVAQRAARVSLLAAVTIVTAASIPVSGKTIFASAAGSVLLFLLLRWSTPWRTHAERLRSDDPNDWPLGRDTIRDAFRQDALQARQEWIRRVFEVGVLPIIGGKIDKFRKPSYDTTLPDASVENLGDITELTQFVPTGTSAQLRQMLESMPTAAIGLSGPRGVGKSTVLRVLGDDRFRSDANDRGLIVHAPTNYDSREFLVHLFAKLCRLVLPEQPSTRLAPAKKWSLLMAIVGVIIAVVATIWPYLITTGAWGRTHPRAVAAVLGGMLVVAAVVVNRRLPRHSSLIEDLARHHLRTLRYLETQTVTNTGQAKTPIGLEFGRSKAWQRAEIARTYPQLVDDFRDFLAEAGLSLRGGANNEQARIVICIDELDKIGTAEQAERFLNDIKAIFRVRHSFFLVSVSEDALTSFARRALAVRTTFDTAFDAVVEVGRFSLTDTRALLVQQVIRMPEPFVWLCHSLSGGLPRDLGRIVRSLYGVRTASNTAALDVLAKHLMELDIRAVARGQLLRASGRTGSATGGAIQWIASIENVTVCVGELLALCETAPALPEDEELALLVAQCCAHLYYAATVLDVFSDRLSITVRQWRALKKGRDHPAEHLAKARTQLSIDPGLTWSTVDGFRIPISGLAPVVPPAIPGLQITKL